MIGAWVAVTDKAQLHRLLRSQTTIFLAIVIVIFSASVSIAVHTGNVEALPQLVREVFLPNDKTNLAPYRILHFLALATLVWNLVPIDAPALRWKAFRPLIVSGRHSLEVFCAGVFLAFLAYFAIDLVSEAAAFQLFVSVVGVVAMTGVAYFRDWVKASKTVSDLPRRHDVSADRPRES
jgi:hypothetical protein